MHLDGCSVAEVCQKIGISEQRFYRWNGKFGWLMPSDVRKLRQLGEENSHVRRLVVAKFGVSRPVHAGLGTRFAFPAPGV